MGAASRRVLRAEACFSELGAPAAVALHLAALKTKLPGVRRSEHSSRMECSFPVEGPASGARGAQRPPTRTPCMSLPTSLHFHLPGSLMEAYLATDYVLCRSECG